MKGLFRAKDAEGEAMSFFDILKPAPHVEELKDQEVVKKKYRYWRLRTFYGMYIGYAFYYFSRKSFTFAMPALIQDLGFDKTQLGMLASILSLTYGLSKFVSGIISDKSNPRYFMAFGLMLTGFFNICFGLSSTLGFFALFWGLNGWFQGWGWPPSAKLLTHWYSQSERGSWWSIWNTSHNLGGAIIPILAAVIANHLGWRWAMYVPGISCMAMGLFVINRLRDSPQSLGLPSIEKFRNENAEGMNTNQEKEAISAGKILMEYVVKNKYIWILSLAYFFIYVIRTAINDWTVLFLIESKGYSLIAAGTTVFWFEAGGFLGSLAAGWSSDLLFKGKRGPVNALFSFGVIFALLAMWKAPAGMLLLDSFLMFVIGFFIFGPQMLIGVAAAELSHKQAAGTATGFAGCFAYIGAAVAGGPLGMIAKDFGWEGFFVVLTISGIISSLLLLPLWNVKVRPKEVTCNETS
jgi:MFS transporter, OPA family, sugar phosphate sensor protein UhpC